MPPSQYNNTRYTFTARLTLAARTASARAATWHCMKYRTLKCSLPEVLNAMVVLSTSMNSAAAETDSLNTRVLRATMMCANATAARSTLGVTDKE